MEIPAISDSLRSERWPTRRWSRMNSPRSRQRCSSSSFIARRLRDRREQPLVERERVTQVRRASTVASPRLVAPGDLRLQGVDAVEQRPGGGARPCARSAPEGRRPGARSRRRRRRRDRPAARRRRCRPARPRASGRELARAPSSAAAGPRPGRACGRTAPRAGGRCRSGRSPGSPPSTRRVSSIADDVEAALHHAAQQRQARSRPPGTRPASRAPRPSAGSEIAEVAGIEEVLEVRGHGASL